MFDHRNLATEGLYPGLVSTFSIAILGALEFRVVLEPVGGGGGGFTFPKIDKYRLKIYVKRKGKEWKYETEVNLVTARVVAKLSGIKLNQNEVTVTSVTARVLNREEPTIKVVKK